MSDPRTGGVTQEPRKTKKNGVKNLKGAKAIPEFRKVKRWRGLGSLVITRSAAAW